MLDGRRTEVALLGRRSPGIQDLLARHGARSGTFVTAWNPLSRPTPRRRNLAAARRMAFCLSGGGFTTLAHVGTSPDGGWAEEGFFVLDIDPGEALALAERFRQNAVVRIARGGPAVLLPTRLLASAI